MTSFWIIDTPLLRNVHAQIVAYRHHAAKVAQSTEIQTASSRELEQRHHIQVINNGLKYVG